MTVPEVARGRGPPCARRHTPPFALGARAENSPWSSFKIAHRIVLDQNGHKTWSARKTTPPPHPPKSCQFVTVTPLRSVPHHKLCSETLPPAHTMRWHFVKAAELKRFQLHSRQSTRCLNNAGWEGGLSKLRTGSFLSQNGHKTWSARKTTPLPPTKILPVCDSHTAALCSPRKNVFFW